MSTASVPRSEPAYSHLVKRTIEACAVAKDAAAAAAEGIATGSSPLLNTIREREKELDTLDREIDDGVTARHHASERNRSSRIARLHEIHDQPGAHRRPAAQFCQQRPIGGTADRSRRIRAT